MANSIILIRGNNAENNFRAVRRPLPVNEVIKASHKYKLIGLSCLRYFPKDHHNIAQRCIAWCHCFRDPDKYIPKNVPKILLSRSDFIDYNILFPLNLHKKYDFLYCCGKSGGQYSSKNIDLFIKCLSSIKNDCKGVVVGGLPRHKIPKGLRCNLDIMPKLPRNKFLKLMQQTKFLFITAEHDASPRIITEAMSLNIPVVLNRNIAGGWKYINQNTGFFFDDENNVDKAFDTILSLSCSMKPREWYADNFGPIKSAIRLGRFMKEITQTRATRLFITV